MKVFALSMVVVAACIFVACAYATAHVRGLLLAEGTGGRCEGPSFYEYRPKDSAWNKRWKRFVYPPARNSYGEVGCCDGSAVTSAEWTKLPETCPVGCGTCAGGACPEEYSERAKRFNKCMASVHRASKCPPHVNDTGRMYAHYARNSQGELDRFSADFDPTNGKRAVFLEMDSFLDDCEARIAYADQQEEYSSTVVGVLLVPTAVWLVILAEMVLCWKKRARGSSQEAHEKADKRQDGAQSATDTAGEIELTDNPMAGGPNMDATAGVENIMALSEIAASRLKGDGKCKTGLRACVNSAYFEQFKFLFGTVLTLYSQQNSFLQPTNRYITDQQLLGGAIAISALCTPILFGLRLERSHTLFDGAFAVFFAVVALQGLVGIFIAVEGPTGVVTHEALSDLDLANKSMAVVLPLLSFALLVRGQWTQAVRDAEVVKAAKEAAAKVLKHEEQEREKQNEPSMEAGEVIHFVDAYPEPESLSEDEQEALWEAKRAVQRKTLVYRGILLCYVLGSFALGGYDAAVVFGDYRCYEFRTCSRRRCDISTEANMRLPFLNIKPELLEKYGAFRPHQGKVENGEASYIFSNYMQATEDNTAPSGQVEWQARQQSMLKYTVDLIPGSEYDDGLPRIVLYVGMQTQQSTRTLTGHVDFGHVNMQYGTSLEPCVSTFRVQCQELRPELAFEGGPLASDPTEWVEYIDADKGVFKLVLDVDNGIPGCWTADKDAAGNAAGWWYDQMLFGPNITAGSTKDGKNILGFVMQNANWTTGEQGDNQGQCIGGNQCGAAQIKEDCTDLGHPCEWGAPNVNNMQRGMKFFSNMTYSVGYGRDTVYTDTWTFSGVDASDVKKVPRTFYTTSYALELKVPRLDWFECDSFETCSWSEPNNGNNNHNNHNNNNHNNNNHNNNNHNNNGGNPPPPSGGNNHPNGGNPPPPNTGNNQPGGGNPPPPNSGSNPNGGR